MTALVVCADCGNEYAGELAASCPNCDSTERLTERHVIVVRLEIAGDPDDAMAAVDQALDEGLLQDFLNDHEIGPLRVTSALASFPDPEPEPETKT
jgi:DNA-directed RNA polymerase subunit RPC12/RpoP